MPFEIVPSGTKIDFIGKWKLAALLSFGLLGASLVAIPIQGVNLGVDFAGGTEMQVHFTGEATDDFAIRNALSETALRGATVVRFGDEENNEFLIRFETLTGDAKNEAVDQARDALIEGVGPAEVERVESVGPRVGSELRRDGMLALLLASGFILLYISFRFSMRFAPGAVFALVHDVVLTAGVFVILGMEFDLRILAALLAILGYSLNDTIILYDRIRENMSLRTTYDLPDVLNRSVNQMLGRTVLTSGTTLAAVFSLYFLGGEVIRPFAFAMIIGIAIGTYSSIFIASPTLLWLERRFGPANAS